MTLTEDACWERLREASHGVLATRHERRGVDAVPVVFAVDEHRIVVPVDVVKPKRHTRLQRLVNIERDGRCALLVDRYDDDWSQLWWVRVHADAVVGPAADALDLLARRFEQYRAPGAVASVLVLTPTEVTGWAA